MQVVRDDLWLCHDCLHAAVNGEAPQEDHQNAATIAGLEELGPHLVPDFDSDTGEGMEEFSRRGCDCCHTGLAGSRHRFAVLGK